LLLLLLFVFLGVRPSLSKSAAFKFDVTSSTVGASFASAFVVFTFFLRSEKDDGQFLLFSFVEDAMTEMFPLLLLSFRCGFVETKFIQRLRLRKEGGVPPFPKSR
jgi:hypothetical protein